MNLLEVRDLKTYFFTGSPEPVRAVDGLSFALKQGEILGIVGESGSGKSVTAHSILRIVKPPGKIVSGQVIFEGTDLLKMAGRKMRRIRASQIAWIPQNPAKAFNPVMAVGRQLEEMASVHRKDIKKKERKEFVAELLKKVGIADPSKKFINIPDEWSGGMAQRAMIAKMSLIAQPRIIIADEPTTALDATVGAQILHLLTGLVRNLNISLILITHDLGIVAEYADRVIVMQQGRSAEENSVKSLFKKPRHPYTQELLAAARIDVRRGEPKTTSPGEVLAKIENLRVYFPVYGGKLRRKKIGAVKAVDGINFDIRRREILGVAGESGCGKSTLARAILRLVQKTEGRIIFCGNDLDGLVAEEADKEIRRKIQMVFQDAYQSLSPKKTAEDIIGEGIDVHKLCGEHKTQRRDRIIKMALEVGLRPALLFRYRRELSDGQRQRVAIARALITLPEFVVLDEPISSLDKKIQKQILELLLHLQQEFGLTYLFISHDLNVLRGIADRLAIMYLGRIVEMGQASEIANHHCHPYTKALFSAQSIADPETARKREKIILQGEVPSPENIPLGCRFHTRCPQRQDRCKEEEPVLARITDSHWAACHLAKQG